jgi:CubicO group peptidase (beta-lactamase class C family)/ubiquinone/menaquinone biosynthesis C-methylase UbiE
MSRRIGDGREPLRRTFDTTANLYDSARPDYPEQLFDDLIRLAGLERGARLLEIGCATGKATRPLLERGFTVVCLELGGELAEAARRNLAGLPAEIHVAPFETWEHQPEAFDLVYAATAWHWVDPAVRYRKAHRLLRPGGHLAFWSALHAFPTDFDSFFTDIQQVYDAIGESHEGEWPPAAPEQIPDDSAELEASGLFEDVNVRRYVWETHYTAEDYIALLNTFSGHIAMEAAKRERLYKEIRRQIDRRPDPRVRRHWHAILHVARRARQPPSGPRRRSSWNDAIIEAGAIGSIVYVGGEVECTGFANLETREPMTPEHRTWVGSIDKTYMALVAVTVFGDLDVPAARWLPQLDERITLRHLLSHRSGLFDYMWDGETYEQLAFGPPALSAPETFLEAALRYPLRNFGEVSYSSSNYAAIDLILELETGRPLGDLLREHVFEPYELSRTTFQVGLEAPPDVAHGYALKGGTFPAVESPRDVSRYWIDRAIAADVHDLASFFRQLFGAHPEMVEEGLGVRAYDHPRGTVYGHGGAMAGYTIQLRATRDGERVVIAAANSHSFPVIRAVVTAVQSLL